MSRLAFPMKLQWFAQSADGAGVGGTGDGGGQQGNTQQQEQQGGNVQTPTFDYEKLASIVTGAQSVKEDTVLKSYFKQQGLSQEEMNQAINSFKQEKAKNTPDINAIQTQLTQAQTMAQQAIIEKEATMEAISLGIDSKTLPYVLKLADLSNVMGEDGKVNADNMKKALNKVLEDVPQLKPSAQTAGGFHIGGTGQEQNNSNEETLEKIFGIRK